MSQKNSIIVANLEVPDHDDLRAEVNDHVKKCEALVRKIEKILDEGTTLRKLTYGGGHNDLFTKLIIARKEIKAATRSSEIDTELTLFIFEED